MFYPSSGFPLIPRYQQEHTQLKKILGHWSELKDVDVIFCKVCVETFNTSSHNLDMFTTIKTSHISHIRLSHDLEATHTHLIEQ